MSHIDLVYEMLKADLSAPRILLDQVVNYINNHYDYPPSELERFFAEKFPKLEDYEVDLIFSPQYTPAEHNRLEYIPLLGSGALTQTEISELKRWLHEERLETLFKTPDEQYCAITLVHEVFIERYVNLLKLTQELPKHVYNAILSHVPEASRNELNLLGRDDVWSNELRQDILIAFLAAFEARGTFSTLKASFLTNFVRSYRPASLLDMDRLLDSLIQSCQTDMDNISGRGLHDEYLKSLNTGNTLTRAGEQDVWGHYKHMMDMAQQLKEDNADIPRVTPTLLEKARQPV